METPIGVIAIMGVVWAVSILILQNRAERERKQALFWKLAAMGLADEMRERGYQVVIRESAYTADLPELEIKKTNKGIDDK